MPGLKHRLSPIKVLDLKNGDRVITEVWCSKAKALKFAIGYAFDVGAILPDVAMIDYRAKSNRSIIWYDDEAFGLCSDAPLKVGHLFTHNEFAKYNGKLKNFKGFK